jgi:transcriptional regulator with XRE-family HTH domain
MLTKRVVQNDGQKRTSMRQTTEKGLALKELRLSRNLSMRQLGNLIGKSDSYISHLENGRLDFPDGESLEKILTAFGDMKPKSFFERARACRMRIHQEDFILKWIREAGDRDLEALYELLSTK